MPDPLPIVLHHGFMGFGSVRVGALTLRNFPGIDRAIIDRGHPLIVTRVPPAASIATRARQLKEQLLVHLAKLPKHNRKLLIIAHSMGGLDARHMITHLGMDDHVAALLTLSTPHRGSPYADWCLRNLGQRLRGLQLARLLALDIQALPNLTTEFCTRFDEQTPDRPGVKYFSISAARPWKRMPPWALHSHKVISGAEGDNDGLVSLASAVHGTHLATWEADHWQMINNRLSTLVKKDPGDIVPRYLAALDRILPKLFASTTTKR
jgi:triacylglycerol lipase